LIPVLSGNGCSVRAVSIFPVTRVADSELTSTSGLRRRSRVQRRHDFFRRHSNHRQFPHSKQSSVPPLPRPVNRLKSGRGPYLSVNYLHISISYQNRTRSSRYPSIALLSAG